MILKLDFFKNIFGNKDNDPRLRGNYLYSNNNQSLIKKGVFTTCKKIKINVLLGNLKRMR